MAIIYLALTEECKWTQATDWADVYWQRLEKARSPAARSRYTCTCGRLAMHVPVTRCMSGLCIDSL